MIEWIKKYHVLMKATAILAAFILWFIVLQVDNPERSVDFDGIPIEFIGQQDLLEEHSLVMISNSAPKVSLELSGSISALTGVSQDDITIRADISKYEKAGEYRVAYDVSAIDKVIVKSRNPSYVTVTLDEVIEKELEVLDPVIDGKIPEDIRLGEAIKDPQTVTISGAASELENAVAAKIVVGSYRLTNTYKSQVDYVIVDSEGNEVTGNTISKVDRKANIEIPVQKVKTVPLVIELEDGAGADVEDAVVEIEPKEVEIIGDVKTIDKIDSIVIGEVSLDDFILSMDGKFELTPPENTEFVEEQESASYRVSFKDIDMAQINVDNIEIINPPPTNEMLVEIDSMSVIVTVRGPKSELKNMTPDDIKLVADLKGKRLLNGRQIVGASTVIDESIEGVAALGQYSIIISTSVPEIPEEVDGFIPE